MAEPVHGEPTNKAGGLTKLFVVGCPRSGTTWVQLLLSEFGDVATSPETQIFAYYLDHFLRQWEHEHESGLTTPHGRAGLSRVLTEDEFFDMCGLTANYVLEKIASRQPEATIICEKSPRHALQVDFIRRVLPDARFIHVIRDPRDTVASMLAASRGWGSNWAPKNAVEAARTWVAHASSMRKATAESVQCLEVRYEDLKRDPVKVLHRMTAWLQLNATQEQCAAAVHACDFAALRKDPSIKRETVPGESTTSDFFRKGQPGSWRDDLSRSEVRVVEAICAPVMKAYGYELTEPDRAITTRIRLHDGIQRIREAIDWKMAQLLDRV